MSNRERRKGRDGEAEVRRLLAGWGIATNALGGREDQPDAIAVLADGRPLMLEVKRQETARVWAWWEQATANAGDLMPAVAFRRSRSEWLAVIRLEDLARLLK